MAPLLNAREVTQTFGALPLFRDISLSISEGERLGLIGPNGSGKSTLLEIFAGTREPDRGEVALRKGVLVGYVAQDSVFRPGESVREVVHRALDRDEHGNGRPGSTRGGDPGPRRLLRFCRGGVVAIGRLAKAAGDRGSAGPATRTFCCWMSRQIILTSRYRVAGRVDDRRELCLCCREPRPLFSRERWRTDIVELNRAYPGGLFRGRGSYSEFLEAKERFLEAQTKRQEALENRVRTEIEWLRRGPKARSDESESTHRQGKRDDRRTGRDGGALEQRHCAISISRRLTARRSG